MSDTRSDREHSFRTLSEILRHHAAQRPDAPALRADDRLYTYRALHAEAARVARALQAQGIGPQDRVAILDRNVPEFFTFLFGASMLGAVTLAVNWRLAAPEMEYILNHSQARVLLIGAEFLGHLEQMKLEADPRIVVLGEGGRFLRYSDWIASPSASDADAGADSALASDSGIAIDPDETCFQLYTSGTTGLPKGVELTHRNLLSAIGIGVGEWDIAEDAVALVAMPLFHIAGSGFGISAFYRGALAVVARELVPAQIFELIEKHRITNALFVPAVLHALGSAPGVEQVDFGSLKQIVYGASPISEEVLVRSMKVFGCAFAQVYGLTETSGAITFMPPEDHDPGGPRGHLLRAAGRPWGDVELRIVDADSGRALPEGEVGEVWCRSRQNMKGYWRNDEATRAVYPEGRDETGLGWFRTGDAGYLQDGYLYIHDRVKDMIVSGGENIYPAEIENVLMGHPGVADVAVIGVPSEKWGETVKAVVVDRAGVRASDDELIAWCRDRLAGYKCPTSIDRIDVLPRNPSGKILKTVLREPFWRGRTRRVN